MKFPDLIAHNVLEEESARAQLKKKPDAIAIAYRDTMQKIPSLHAFFNHVRDSYRHSPNDGAKVIDDLWFRIWLSLESDKALGSTATLDLLARVANPNDRVVEIRPQAHTNPLAHCLRQLQELVVPLPKVNA